MLQIQQTKITEFLASFRERCDRHSIKIKFDYQPHGVDKLGSSINLKTKRITFSTSQIEQISDQLNIPPLDMWQIVAFHELGHFFKGSEESEAWEWAIQNCKVNPDFLEVARSHALYSSLISAKGNWSQVKKAIASRITEHFIDFANLWMNTPTLRSRLPTLGGIWLNSRKEASHEELEVVASTLCEEYKFDLIWETRLTIQLEAAAIGFYKSVQKFL
jgi:hypothetical protein